MDEDPAFLELKRHLEAGAAEAERGELLDGEEVFEELDRMIDEIERSKTAVPSR